MVSSRIQVQGSDVLSQSEAEKTRPSLGIIMISTIQFSTKRCIASDIMISDITSVHHPEDSDKS